MARAAADGRDKMRSNASSIPDLLCDLGQRTSPLWASVFSSIRWKD